jgi:hypothetical protein
MSAAPVFDEQDALRAKRNPSRVGIRKPEQSAA